MSRVLPPVKENIYIPSPFAFHDKEGKQRAGYSGEGGARLPVIPGAGDIIRASPRRFAGSLGRRCPLSPHQWPGSPGLRYLPQPPWQAAPSPSLCCTLNSSKGASLTAPHEIITHYVTRRKERECKCLDGISVNPRRDDLGAVIIHLIGAWGKLLDREM